MGNCPNCQTPLDVDDRFCRRCGAQAAQAPPSSPGSRVPPLPRPVGFFGGLFRPVYIPTPDQAAGYWRNFFRPFFIAALVLFGVFFLASLVLVVIWFFMFGHGRG